MNIDLRNTIAHALAALCATPTSDAARAFFAALGYSGTRTFPLSGLNDFLEEFDPAGELRSRNKAYLHEWRSIDLLFQLTDDDLTGEGNLFTETRVDKGLMRSYLFFHVVLTGDSYPRSKLAQITRQINRLFTMPIMVLFSYGSTLSIAVINRRRNKIDASKDVLGKVTLIHGIRCADPHRGHLDILASFSIPELARRGTVSNFDTLHAALEEVFNVDLLNRLFYSKIQKWFFWAIQEIAFPRGGIDDPNQRNRMAAIRLLTRVIFCWFAREKRLIPSALFSAATARKVLKDFDPLSRKDGTYYTAILQNLFFPTLSVPLDQREFRNGHRYKGVNKHYMRHEYFRHEAAFKEPGDIPRLFENIPFLNGGLFACLDYLDKEDNEIRVDGFSDTASKQPRVPNILFFGKDVPVDISAATGNPTDTAVKIDGLFTILDGFKFTVTENTPVEEEIALDPELLGLIFEKLLAEYNPETEKTARKQTGSFYTPRNIVDYMVGESLKAYLDAALRRKLPAVTAADAREGLDILFSYTEREHAFTAAEKHVLVDAIYDAAILDPACGSGAFPMGMLQKLVYVLDKLDHGHDHWKRRILADTPAAMKEQTGKWLDSASADFTWKLGLVQRSIYGIDIQPFAVQIAKLRCFVSLLVDFDVDPAADNYGVPSLPNLDFKFVAANTLIRPPSEAERDDDPLKLEDPFFKDFAALAEDYFFVRDPAEKKDLKEKIEALIERQIETHTNTHVNVSKAYREENKRRLALWQSYRNIFAFRNGHVGFFDPRYFFPEIKEGFDIVIGNPPYVRADEQSDWNQVQRRAILADEGYETLWEKWDLFVPFIERSVKLLKPGGVSALIVSDAFCHAKYAQKCQNWLLANTRILRLDFCGDLKIFDAAVHNVIPLIQKADGKDNVPERRLHREIFGNVTFLPSDQQSKLTCRAFFPDEAAAQVFTCNSILISEICYISVGMVVNANEKGTKGAFELKDLLSDVHDARHPKPFIEGKDVGKWIPISSKWIEWSTTRAPAQFRRKTFPELYEQSEKLLLVKVGDVRVAYDEKELYTNEGIYLSVPWHSLSGVRNNSLKKAARYADERPLRPDLPQREKLEATSRRFAVKYLLAVMNSSVARDFLRANRRNNIQLYPDDWKKLPIPDVPPERQQPLVALVDRILADKRADPAADVSALEAEIDRLVYDLYGLTTPETAMVEGKE
ncbi:MAG TPA: Eco57I restriction-modification methylase domain-containing protein [Kiritimatiellia bacterium]|nr:Eco57I restriction-modification methylase domain-containing protein [Kiritimatiellia bacterium]